MNSGPFRTGLLDGCRAATAGLPDTLADRLTDLAAGVERLPDDVAAGSAGTDDDEVAAAWVAARLPLTGLLHDTRPDFGGGGQAALAAALQRAWIIARAVAVGALIPVGKGRLLFIAPTPEAGPLAASARAGLENLARTLSVEWARHAVTAVAICPGPGTTDAELAELAAFLLSEAGGYFTGCRFDLGLVPVAPVGLGPPVT